MAGIKEIAKRTGLSVATVSRVFNNSALVSPKTKRKVLRAAGAVGYRHNRIAAALRSGTTGTIGVVVPEINNYFFGHLINGIEKKLADKGYSAIITQSHESMATERAALDSLMRLNVDGILISNTKETTDFRIFLDIQNEGTPVVFFDRMPAMAHASAVLLDDFKGGQIATRHLIDQGCANLVHIAGDPNVSIFNKRKEGFLDIVEKHPAKVKSHHLVQLSFDVEQDRRSIEAMLRKNPRIDGIFSHGDKFGVHTMNILRLLGHSVPEQVKLIGFGNNDYTELTHPKMSSIDQKCSEMGALAVAMLLDNLKKETIVHSRKILMPKLIARGSSVD